MTGESNISYVSDLLDRQSFSDDLYDILKYAVDNYLVTLVGELA